MTTLQKYKNTKKKYIALKRAVRRLIVAEFKYRLGEHYFENETSKKFVNAQEELRLILTKKKGLWDAAIVVADEMVQRERAAVDARFKKNGLPHPSKANDSQHLRRIPKSKVRKT